MQRSFGSAHRIYTDYARGLIRTKARLLVSRADISRSDEEDIVQEITMHLFNQANRFDPNRSTVNTFVSIVVESGVAMLLRRRNCMTRKPMDSQLESLESLVDVGDETPTELGSLISLEDLERRTSGSALSDFEVLEVQEAVGHAIGGLPPELQRICEELKLVSPYMAARNLGMSLNQLNQSLGAIREYFTREGLNQD